MQLWERFEKYTLMHNHRQGDDRIWAENLNQIRVSDGDDLPDEIIDKIIQRVTNDPMLDDGVIHAFYPNKEVNAHNAKQGYRRSSCF